MNDEYISKQKIIDYLNGYLHSLGEGGADDLLFDRGQRRALINAIQDISAVKAADVQPVKLGRWITWDDSGFTKCSCCNSEYYIADLQEVGDSEGFVDFCPRCGTRMDGNAK